MPKETIITAVNDLLALTALMIFLFISGFLIEAFCLFLFPLCGGNKILMVMVIVLWQCFKYIALVFTAAAAWLLFRRKKLFPRAVITWSAIAAIGLLIYIIFILLLGCIWRLFLKIHPIYPIIAFIFMILWGLYLKLSKWVKKTFVRELTRTDVLFLVFISFIIFIFVAFYFYKEIDFIKGLLSGGKS